MILDIWMYKTLIITMILSGCATDVSHETQRSWCVGACVIEHTKTQRHSETTSKSAESEISDK